MSDEERLVTMLPLSLVPQSSRGPVSSGEQVSTIVEQSSTLGGLLPMMMEILPAPIFVADDRFRLVLVNGAARRLLAEDGTKFLGYSVGRFLSLERLEAARVTLLSRVGSHEYRDSIFVGGIEREIEVRLELLESGGAEYLCGSLVDLTDAERERAEWEEVKRPSSPPSTRIEQAHRLEALGHLMGALAHDFNNLLSVIQGSLTTAERRIFAGQDATEDIQRARIATERSIESTSQILRYARQRSAPVQSVDPLILVSELQGLVERALGEGVRLIFQLEPTPAIIAGAAQLETAILNLVINARDAIKEGGEVKVSLTTRTLEEEEADLLGLRSGAHVSLSVSDDGAGMSEEVKRHVFEPFYTTKPEGRGTGLGLSTVRSIVQKSGGAIRLSSAIDEGTTVELLFPAD